MPFRPRSSRCSRGEGVQAPGTAISVHFQLFPHWRLIGQAAQQRQHCAAIGRLLAGQCTNYVTVQSHVTRPPPCWTADCCADDCSLRGCLGFVLKQLQIMLKELAVAKNSRRNLCFSCASNLDLVKTLVCQFRVKFLNWHFRGLTAADKAAVLPTLCRQQFDSLLQTMYTLSSK